MKLFQMKTKPHGIARFDRFMEENMVCIGWPGIGDLTNIDKDEIRSRIAQEYRKAGHQLGNALGQVNTFINTMQTGDMVVVAAKEWAYFGKVGDYTYLPQFDNDDDGMCHRRSVEWVKTVAFTDIAPNMLKLINNRNTICEFPEPFDETILEQLTGKKPLLGKEDTLLLDDLFRKALKVLEEELASDNPDRRLKAATELLKIKTQACRIEETMRLNPQAHLMNSAGILTDVITAVEQVIKANFPHTLSSSEIYQILPIGIQNSIVALSSQYKNSACAKPESYVGTAASMLCKSNKNFYHDYHYYCPVLKRNEDGFRELPNPISDLAAAIDDAPLVG